MKLLSVTTYNNKLFKEYAHRFEKTYNWDFPYTVYNEDDEARYVSFLIGALENSEFPALSNPLLVSPAKCTILEMNKSDFWEETETIEIYENDFDISMWNR